MTMLLYPIDQPEYAITEIILGGKKFRAGIGGLRAMWELRHDTELNILARIQEGGWSGADVRNTIIAGLTGGGNKDARGIVEREVDTRPLKDAAPEALKILAAYIFGAKQTANG